MGSALSRRIENSAIGRWSIGHSWSAGQQASVRGEQGRADLCASIVSAGCKADSFLWIQIAPVVDASSAQSRADVLVIGLSAVLVLTGLQWVSLKPKPLTAVRALVCGLTMTTFTSEAYIRHHAATVFLGLIARLIECLSLRWSQMERLYPSLTHSSPAKQRQSSDGEQL